MANPQRENGHIDIANEIAEQLTKINLRPYEWRTLWAVFRKTYGWHKKEDDISLTQFQKLTGLERRHQRKALKTLTEKNIIIRRKDGYIVTYGFQKDYTQWKVVLKQAPLTNISDSAYSGTTPVLKQAPKVVPEQAPTKEKKETNTKENIPTQIYEYYSKTIRSGAKEDATRNIAKLLKNGETKESLMARITAYKEHLKKEGQADNRYFIQANNFFGRAARYKDFEPKESKYQSVNPNCKLCNGTGFIFIEATSANAICNCRKRANSELIMKTTPKAQVEAEPESIEARENQEKLAKLTKGIGK